MKQKFVNALSLALIVAMLFTSVALADPIVNSIDTTVDPVREIKNLTAGGSVSVGFFDVASNVDPTATDANGCNSTGSNQSTVTLSVPAGVTATPVSFNLAGCGLAEAVYVSFTSNTPGDYEIDIASVTGGKAGSQWNTAPAGFTLHVTAASKQNPIITWGNPTDIVYGTPLSGTQLNATASVAGTFVYTPAAATVLNAGAGQTLHVDFTPSDTTLYNSASKDVTINVLKAAAGCSIIGYSGVYDGNPYGASGTCTGVGTLDLGASFTNVPGGTADWIFTGDFNHENASGSVAIDITQGASTVTVTCPPSVVYNTLAQEPCTAEATGVGMSPVDVTDSLVYSNNINAGTATVEASWDGDNNHIGSTGSGSFTIEKADASCSISGYTGVYDTAYHGATGTCSGIGGESAGMLDLGASFKDVPGGTVDWSFTGNGNYKDKDGTAPIVITKADAACSVSGYSGVFDNIAHGASGSCSGINGENAGTLNLGQTYTYPTGGPADWTFTGNGNYNDQSGSVQITISAWTYGGFYQPVDMGSVWNTVKGGSTVPLKFEVFAAGVERTDVGSVESYAAREVACTALPGAVEDAVETLSATGGTSLRYDMTGGQFIFNWQTLKTTGKCYQVTVTLLDHSRITAFFKTK